MQQSDGQWYVGQMVAYDRRHLNEPEEAFATRCVSYVPFLFSYRIFWYLLPILSCQRRLYARPCNSANRLYYKYDYYHELPPTTTISPYYYYCHYYQHFLY